MGFLLLHNGVRHALQAEARSACRILQGKGQVHVLRISRQSLQRIVRQLQHGSSIRQRGQLHLHVLGQNSLIGVHLRTEGAVQRGLGSIHCLHRIRGFDTRLVHGRRTDGGKQLAALRLQGAGSSIQRGHQRIGLGIVIRQFCNACGLQLIRRLAAHGQLRQRCAAQHSRLPGVAHPQEQQHGQRADEDPCRPAQHMIELASADLRVGLGLAQACPLLEFLHVHPSIHLSSVNASTHDVRVC